MAYFPPDTSDLPLIECGNGWTGILTTSNRMRERVDRYFDYQQDCWIDLYAKRQRR